MNKYRKQGDSLFEYSEDQNAYVCVYSSYRCKTLKQLIAAYEEKQLQISESE